MAKWSGLIRDKRDRFLGAMALLAAAGLLLIAAAAWAEPPLPVLVSIEPQADIVEQIGDALVKVDVLVPKSANPHSYEPTMDKLAAVDRAKIYFRVGHPRFAFEEPWTKQAQQENPGLLIVNSFDGVEDREMDPHLWTAPSHVRVMARQVAKALQEALPPHAEEIAANLKRFEGRLDKLDADLKALFAKSRGANFFVFHPAWGYLAEEYGLNQIAIEQDGKEPDVMSLGRIIVIAQANHAKVIFVEPMFSEDSAKTVAREVGAKIEVLDPMARDWEKNLRASAAKIAEAVR